MNGICAAGSWGGGTGRREDKAACRADRQYQKSRAIGLFP